MLPGRAPRPLIGWNELVDLPEWGVRRLRAKVDTGARTSALHVDRVGAYGSHRVRFDVVQSRRDHARRVHVVSSIARVGRVRSSSGHYAERFFVRTWFRLAGLEREIEISLVDRERMVFRMLLGRSALAGFLVDPTRRQLQRSTRSSSRVPDSESRAQGRRLRRR